MSVKLRDFIIADDILEIIEREVSKIKGVASPDERDIARLEKLAKTYTTVMSSTRENYKQGLFGKLDAKELNKAIESGDDTGESDDESGDPFS